MKKHLKRLLSMMMAVLLCFGIFPSSAFAKEYEYDGYISMIDHKSRRVFPQFQSSGPVRRVQLR